MSNGQKEEEEEEEDGEGGERFEYTGLSGRAESTTTGLGPTKFPECSRTG